MAQYSIIDLIFVGVALVFLIGNGVKSDVPSGKNNTHYANDERYADRRYERSPYPRYPRYDRSYYQYPYDRRDYGPPVDRNRYYNEAPYDPRYPPAQQPQNWPPYDRRDTYPTYQRYYAPSQYDPRYSYYNRPAQGYYDPRYGRAPDGSYYRAPYDPRYGVPPQRPLMPDRRYDGYSYDPENNRRGYGPYDRP